MLRLGGAALDALGDRAVDMVVGDPALVVVLAISASGGARGRLVARQRLGDLSLLGFLGDGRGATGGLREEGLDPGLVDEVEDAAEEAGQEEVEEDAGGC